MSQELKSCPFCGATPHQGKTKIEYDQLHGEPFQRYQIFCPHQCAHVIESGEELARTRWNTRVSDTRIAELEAEVSARGIEAHQMRAERDAAKVDVANWYRLHDELEAEAEKLKEQLSRVLAHDTALKEAYQQLLAAQDHTEPAISETVSKHRTELYDSFDETIDDEARILSALVQP